MNKPQLYIFVGYPGAGKTTTSKLIQKITGAKHIWADHERHRLFKPVTYSAKESKILYTKLNNLCEDYLKAGESVIYDTNFNFKADRQLLRKLAIDNNADLKLVWIDTDKNLARQRATSENQDSDTRVLGTMSESDFERISGRLEKPTEDEQPIIISGDKLDLEIIKSKLCS